MKEVICQVDENGVIQACGKPTDLAFQAPSYVHILVDDHYQPHSGYDKIVDGHLESHEAEWRRAKEVLQHNNVILGAIDQLKHSLTITDYLATKHSEGLISEEEYAPIKAERQGWRDQINELEAQLWTE